MVRPRGRTGIAQPGLACAHLHMGGVRRARKGSLTTERIHHDLPERAALSVQRRLLRRGRRCYKRQVARRSSSMNLVSIPANPVPDERRSRDVEDRGRRVAALCALAAAAAAQAARVCIFQGRAEFIEKYFETVRDLRARGFAVATFDWRGQGLSDRALADRAQGPCPQLRRIRRRSRSVHARDRAARLSAAAISRSPIRWARAIADPRRASRPPLVRSHGADSRR